MTRLSHPRAEFDLVVREDEHDGWFRVWLSDYGVIGSGESERAALRDAHMALSILLAMIVEQGLT